MPVPLPLHPRGLAVLLSLFIDVALLYRLQFAKMVPRPVRPSGAAFGRDPNRRT